MYALFVFKKKSAEEGDKIRMMYVIAAIRIMHNYYRHVSEQLHDAKTREKTSATFFFIKL